MSEKVGNRNRAVLNAAVAVAESLGFAAFTRSDVAAQAGVATGSVNNAFGTMDGLRDAVMAEAIAREMLPLVAQGVAARHPAALAATPELKARALASLAA